MSRESSFPSENGGLLVICTDSPAAACVDGEREYLRWHVGDGRMFGIVKNSRELRSWLRRALRRLESDARRGKRKLKGAD